MKGAIFDMDGTVFDAPYDWKKIKDELRTQGKPILVHIKDLSEPEKSAKWKILEKYEQEATQQAVLKDGMKEFIRFLKENHLKTVEDVTDYVKAGGGCGNCHDRIGEIISEVRGKPVAIKSQPKILTNVQKIRMIEETLDREIKPALNQDGGDIELVDFDQNTVYVRLRGTCSTCAASQVTLKSYVETKLKELVSPELVVSEVTQ